MKKHCIKYHYQIISQLTVIKNIKIIIKKNLTK